MAKEDAYSLVTVQEAFSSSATYIYIVGHVYPRSFWCLGIRHLPAIEDLKNIVAALPDMLASVVQPLLVKKEDGHNHYEFWPHQRAVDEKSKRLAAIEAQLSQDIAPDFKRIVVSQRHRVIGYDFPSGKSFTELDHVGDAGESDFDGFLNECLSSLERYKCSANEDVSELRGALTHIAAIANPSSPNCREVHQVLPVCQQTLRLASKILAFCTMFEKIAMPIHLRRLENGTDDEDDEEDCDGHDNGDGDDESYNSEHTKKRKLRQRRTDWPLAAWKPPARTLDAIRQFLTEATLRSKFQTLANEHREKAKLDAIFR
jgi:hypothetical protein